MWAKTENIWITWKISISWKKMQKKFFFNAFTLDRYRWIKTSDLYLLPYGPLEPMVINFICDLSLVCFPPRWSPLIKHRLPREYLTLIGQLRWKMVRKDKWPDGIFTYTETDTGFTVCLSGDFLKWLHYIMKKRHTLDFVPSPSPLV